MPGKAILVVDDEKNIRLTLAESLEEFEREVLTAVNGEDALEQLETHAVDLMLLDLKMPGMGGMEVLRQVAKSRPEIRVIIITAHGSIPSAVEAMKLGAADFLEKPFSPEEVREVIRGVLTRDTITANSVTGYEEHIALAKRAINDRHPASAIEHARQAIAVDADRPDAFNLLGALLEVTGDRAGALKQYRIALELDPTHKGARENLERATSSSWRSSTPRRPGFE